MLIIIMVLPSFVFVLMKYDYKHLITIVSYAKTVSEKELAKGNNYLQDCMG